jgi:hypothetical protein
MLTLPAPESTFWTETRLPLFAAAEGRLTAPATVAPVVTEAATFDARVVGKLLTTTGVNAKLPPPPPVEGGKSPIPGKKGLGNT